MPTRTFQIGDSEHLFLWGMYPDSAEILEEFEGELNRIAETLRLRPGKAPRTCNIAGTTSFDGDKAYNEALARRRGAAVRDYLLDHGVPTGRIWTCPAIVQAAPAPGSMPEGAEKWRGARLLLNSRQGPEDPLG